MEAELQDQARNHRDEMAKKDQKIKKIKKRLKKRYDDDKNFLMSLRAVQAGTSLNSP